jgi:hypothetical protein
MFAVTVARDGISLGPAAYLLSHRGSDLVKRVTRYFDFAE